jgi:hypothetical protein
MKNSSLFLEKALFSPIPTYNLSFFRFLFCSLTALYFILLAPVHNYIVETNSYWKPIVDYYHFVIFGQDLFYILRYLFILSLIFSALGLFTRSSLALSAMLHFLYEYPIGATYMPYTTNMIFYILIILCLSPGISAYGLDARKQSARGDSTTIPSWPFWIVKLILSITYFCSFYSKVRAVGWRWADGHSLQLFIYDRFLATNNPLAELASRHLSISYIFGILTLVFEGTFWLILLFPRLTPFYVLLGIGFHVGIYLVFDLNFLWLFCTIYFIFPNWHKLLMTKPRSIKSLFNSLN